jgi:hypothetical protein
MWFYPGELASKYIRRHVSYKSVYTPDFEHVESLIANDLSRVNEILSDESITEADRAKWIKFRQYLQTEDGHRTSAWKDKYSQYAKTHNIIPKPGESLTELCRNYHLMVLILEREWTDLFTIARFQNDLLVLQIPPAWSKLYKNVDFITRDNLDPSHAGAIQ